MQFWLLGALLPHAAAFAGPSLLRPRLPALRTGTPALVLEHAAPVLDSVTTSLAFADQAGNLAGALFPASLPPYLLFLYFICQDVNGLSAEAKAGFTSLLGFVFMTVATSIVSTKTFGLNLANVDWLHSGAEQLLSFTNVANVIGLKLTLDAYNAGGGATPAPSGGLLSSKVLPAIGGTAALFFAATWAAAGSFRAAPTTRRRTSSGSITPCGRCLRIFGSRRTGHTLVHTRESRGTQLIMRPATSSEKPPGGWVAKIWRS